MTEKKRLEPQVDAFETAGHRFNEWGVCVTAVTAVERVDPAVDTCGVCWEDIEDVDDLLNAQGVCPWLGMTGIAHSRRVTMTELSQIVRRKKAIRDQCCVASGWSSK